MDRTLLCSQRLSSESCISNAESYFPLEVRRCFIFRGFINARLDMYEYVARRPSMWSDRRDRCKELDIEAGSIRLIQVHVVHFKPEARSALMARKREGGRGGTVGKIAAAFLLRTEKYARVGRGIPWVVI